MKEGGEGKHGGRIPPVTLPWRPPGRRGIPKGWKCVSPLSWTVTRRKGRDTVARLVQAGGVAFSTRRGRKRDLSREPAVVWSDPDQADDNLNGHRAVVNCRRCQADRPPKR